MSSNKSKNIFSTLSKAVDILGEDETENILRQATQKNHKSQHISFVVKMVCEKFSLKHEQINIRTRNSKILLAINYICYYGYVVGKNLVNKSTIKDKRSESAISFQDIGAYIGRSRQLAITYYNEMEKKKKEKTDAYNQANFKEFDAQVKEYLKSIK